MRHREVVSKGGTGGARAAVVYLRPAIAIILLLASSSLSLAADETRLPTVQRARDLLRLKEVKAAHTELSQVLAANPENAAAHFEIGRILLAYDPPLYEEAIKHLTYAVEHDSKSSDYNLWLARAWGMKLERSNVVAAALGPVWKVKNHFEEAVRLDPKNAPAVVDLFQYYLFAPALVGGGRDKALTQLKNLTGIAPDSILAHTSAAILALKDNDFDTASISFERIAQLDVENGSEAYFQMGIIYLAAEQYGKAEKFLLKAQKNGARVEQPYKVLAPNYVRNGFYEKARYEIENNVRVAVDSSSLSKEDRMARRETPTDPAYPRLLRLVAAIYEQSNRTQLAMLYMQRAKTLGVQP